MEKEYRVFEAVELRAENDEKFIVTGRPIVYGIEADLGFFRETIHAGAAGPAFDKYPDVYMVWQHDMARPIARTKNGTLKLAEDAEGVRIEADLSRTQRARDAYHDVKSGLIDGMSFKFAVARESWREEMLDGKTVAYRDIFEFERVYEVSPVAGPAYETTELQARSAEDAMNSRPATAETEPATAEDSNPDEPSHDYYEARLKGFEYDMEESE